MMATAVTSAMRLASLSGCPVITLRIIVAIAVVALCGIEALFLAAGFRNFFEGVPHGVELGFQTEDFASCLEILELPHAATSTTDQGDFDFF